MSENKGPKRPRIGQKKEHKDEFMQDRYFGYHHHGSEEENNDKPEGKERKFGNRRSGRDFDNERPRRRFDNDEKPFKRRFNDDEERPRRRFNDDEDRPRRRFNNDNDRPRRRFNDDDERPRRRFNDDDRPRRRFDNEERPTRRRFNDDDERPRRRFNDEEERPRRRFNDEESRGRGGRGNGRKPFGDKDREGFGGKTRRRFDKDEPRNEYGRGGNRRNFNKFNDEEDEAPRRGRKGYQREKDPLYDRPKATGEIRLNKYLADSGICSRREADELIKAGCVTVNGEVVTAMGIKVKPEDKVVYGGQTLNREKLRYVLLNKPKGYITTSDDPQERDTVMDLMKDVCPERIFPVGRLDKMTTGLLLFTNDGDLTKRLTHPSSEVPKLYQVTLDKPLTKNDMLRIAEGIELDDGPIAADSISYVEGDDSKKEIGIELHSGRNRIVRRIFEHLGYEVLKLDRTMFAGLDKYKLPRGEWRFLTDLEVNMLKKI